MPTISIKFTYPYERARGKTRRRTAVLHSIPLPERFDAPRHALVGFFGGMRGAQAKSTSPERVVAFVTVCVEVNRVPTERIGWGELNNPAGEPFHYLPLGRLKNDAVFGFLKTMAPEFEAGRQPLGRVLSTLGAQLDRVEAAIREISPATRVASLDVGEPSDRRRMALLLRRDGATIVQPGAHHPFIFEFPKMLLADQG